MTVLITVPERTYQAGTDEVGPVAVPVGLTKINITLTRVSWPAVSPLLRARIEISFDGGATWPEFVESRWDGGDYIDRRGNLVTAVKVGRDLKQPQNPNRRARAIAERAAALDTGITLEAT